MIHFVDTELGIERACLINAASYELWRLAVPLKLSALQRSGIVLSVIWILGVAGYAGYILYHEKQDDPYRAGLLNLGANVNNL
jgi:hypothetical protein